MRHGVLRGQLLMLASAFCFALMALCTRLLPRLPSIEKVFFRSLFGLILVVGIYVVTHRPLGRPGNYRCLLWRGVAGTAALLCYFYAIDHIGLPKATLYCYTYPVWSALFAWFELREKPHRLTLWSLPVGVVGTVLTLDFSGGNHAFSIGDVVGLAAGALTGSAIVSVRLLRGTESSGWIVIFFTLVGTVVTAFPTAWHFVVPHAREWLLVVGMVAFATVAQLLMTNAYRVLTAAQGGLLSLTVVVWSAMFGTLFLGDTMPMRFWIGAAMILGSAAVATLEGTRGESTPVPCD